MTLAWVTGVSGSGKSAVCETLQRQGRTAIDGDWEGYSHWVDRQTGDSVLEPPYPAPPGWLDRFAWKVRPRAVAALVAELAGGTGYLCGGFENDTEVLHYFDRVVCLSIDEPTLIDRLATRTTNHFGKHPEELRAALEWQSREVVRFGGLGATIVDATAPLEVVVAQVVAAVEGERG